jgi:hypothetical protein
MSYIPNPVELLRDDKGVYGIGLCQEYLAADLPPNWPSQQNRLVLRPDRVEEACGRWHPVLQWLPQRGLLFDRSQEAELRDTMCEVMRHCAGITDKDRPLGDKRRAFYGLRVKATRVFNWLYGQALTAADPEALRVARRFPPSMRWEIYSAAARSPHMRQLAETFPLLAYVILVQGICNEHERALKEEAAMLVERGARLRDVAATAGLPTALRRIKPGAVHLVSTGTQETTMALNLLCEHPKLLAHMPGPLPYMRRWLRAVQIAHQTGGGDYAAWVAKHATDLDQQQIEDLNDWIAACNRQADVRAEQQITDLIDRPFVPTMSLATVRKLSAEWHEAIEKKEDGVARPFPPPWFPASPLVNGYDIVPITNSADLNREGRVMHNCVGSYSDPVTTGDCYIYGIREGDKRIATVEIARDQHDKPYLAQIRGPCNAPAPKAIVTAAERWLRSQKKELPPLPALQAAA